jgi:hypothetical protein
MYRLYNEYGATHFPGDILSDRVDILIRDFHAQYPDADLNDIENIIGQTAGAVVGEMRLRHAMKMRKAKRVATKTNLVLPIDKPDNA